MFKMKGPSMHKGTAGHKEAVQTRYKELAVARNMDQNMPDGRSKTSPFQAKTDKDDDGYKYGKEKLVSETTTKNKRGGVDTERKYETKGTKYTPPKRTAKGDAKYAAMTPAERKAADDKYIAANTKTKTKSRTERESTKAKLEPIKVKPKSPKLNVETKMEPVKATPPKDKPKKTRDNQPKKKRKTNIFKRTGDAIGDAVRDVGDNISRRRHMRKNRVGRRRRGRRTIGCGPR